MSEVYSHSQGGFTADVLACSRGRWCLPGSRPQRSRWWSELPPGDFWSAKKMAWIRSSSTGRQETRGELTQCGWSQGVDCTLSHQCLMRGMQQIKFNIKKNKKRFVLHYIYYTKLGTLRGVFTLAVYLIKNNREDIFLSNTVYCGHYPEVLQPILCWRASWPACFGSSSSNDHSLYQGWCHQSVFGL